MIGDLQYFIEEVNQRRTGDDTAGHDRVIDILEAADPVAAVRQLDPEVRQLALDEALSDVPASYRSIVSEACTPHNEREEVVPLYLIGLCVQTQVDVLVQLIEGPSGGRDQFGVWVDMSGFRASDNRNYLVILEASGGAVICNSYYNPQASFVAAAGRHTERFSGSFNEDGALTASDPRMLAPMTMVVYSRAGTEYIDAIGSSYSRVTAMNEDVLAGIQECL